MVLQLTGLLKLKAGLSYELFVSQCQLKGYITTRVSLVLGTGQKHKGRCFMSRKAVTPNSEDTAQIAWKEEGTASQQHDVFPHPKELLSSRARDTLHGLWPLVWSSVHQD